MNAPANLPARLPMPPTVTQQGVTPAQWKVLTEAIFPAAKTPEAVELAIAYCRSRKLDIMKRPVHIVPVWSKEKNATVETIWPGINEVQVTAARTGQWAGMDPPRFGPDVTMDFHGEKGEATAVTYPEWCEVTVYRMVEGQRCGFTETVYWLETYSKRSRWDERPNEMWSRRSRGQLAKCAKAASLRAAFPEEGELTAEEMEGKEIEAGGVVIDAQAEEVQAPRKPFWTIFDDHGMKQHTEPMLDEALRRYGEVKAARNDKLAVAVNNLELLRAAAAAAPAGGGLRTKIENEIAAAEAFLAEDQAKAEPEGEPEATPEDDRTPLDLLRAG